MNDCARIYSFLLFCCFVGCQDFDRSETPSTSATISGSSMEPALKGQQRLAYCEACKQRNRFSADSISDSYPTRCPLCGSNVTYEGWQDAEEVQVVRLEPKKHSIRRGEIVVLRDGHTDKLEVKRVVGLPHESLKFINGDLWVDGQIFQKSMSQFLSQAIEVDRWSEVEGTHCVLPGDTPTVHSYQYLSLWPQYGRELRAHPSPILDEYRSNAAESRQLVPVRDIGLKLALSTEIVRPVKMEIQLWVDDAIRRLQISISSEENERKTDNPRDCALSSIKSAHATWDSHHSRSLIVAMVDGRVIVGNDQRCHSFSISDLVSNTDTSEQNTCSAETPITLAVLDGEFSITQAIVVRDIQYRGWDGEEEFTLPATNGFHVLGDNVSNSADSRQRWPDGVPADCIIGRIKNR